MEVRGIENIPRKGGILLASNHLSMLDPVVVGAVCIVRARDVEFMAKAELFANRFFAALITTLHSFPVNRSKSDIAAVKEALKRLQQGKALLMFPVGTRSSGPTTQAAQQGIGFLAKRTGAAIVPVRISGTDRALPKGSWLIRPTKVTVSFGEPYHEYSDASYEKIADEVLNRIRALS